MNSIKTLKNSAISVVGQICTLLLQFINRRIFVMFLDIEYLGYQSVFGNVFSLLSVAELGVGGIISFHLYRELVTDNRQEIGKLMYLYKWVYRFIAIAVAILGLIASVFVPYIVNDASRDIYYLYAVYFLQLSSTVAGYFLSYRRTIYAADQKEYKTIEIDLFVNILVQTVQLSLLAIFRNYLLYLAIHLSTSIIANLIIWWKTDREYPYLKEKYAITEEDIRKRNLTSDIKNVLAHKISGAIYGGTDSIVVSSICGIRSAALYGNYFLLQQGVLSVLFYRLLNPVQATIGKIVYSDRSKSELWKQFEMLDVFSFFFASYISLGFLVFFQPAIQIWMGSTEYLLSDAFVEAYSLTVYFTAVWEIIYKYRSAFGDYRQDRNCRILSAVLNVVLSIMLAYKIGIAGVQIGTFFSFLPIAYGRIRFVVGRFFGQSIIKYLIKHMFLFFIVLIESMLIYWITRVIPLTAIGMSLRLLIWFIVPTVINVLLYFRNSHFRDLCSYLKMLSGLIISRVWNRG